MAVVLSMAKCPNCGAPHDVDPQRNSVICIYCNTSLRVERAIAHYMRVASVSHDEAERAIAQLVVSSYYELTKRLPINAFGFVQYIVRFFACLALAGWAATRAVDSPGWFALVALGLLLAVLQLVGFVPHLQSTLIASSGAPGRGRVLRRAILRGDEEKDEYLIAVMFEVVPDDASPPFVDQENVFVGGVTLQKLVPNNVVRVRFNSSRNLVFVQSPVTVLS